MSDPNDDLPLIRQYRDWLQSSTTEGAHGREQFFTEGLVVLDTNLLLNLYEYTPNARNQVLSALERVKERLWLPHQVGLEFVRNRHRVIATRVKSLNDAPNELNRKLREATKAIISASELVQGLLIKYAQDTESSESLRKEISDQSIKDLLDPWRNILIGHIQHLKNDHDLAISTVANGDPVLPQVAELFGERIATPPSPDVTRQRVEEAVSYRFPNKIPPGYMDAGKGSPLTSAGDFLLWEEIITHVAKLPDITYVLFVSGDQKDDWYEASGPGQARRPWPSLADELRERAAGELRIETPKEFFLGVKQYLDVEIAETTYEEIGRAAEAHVSTEITETRAGHFPPPSELATEAYIAAGLKTPYLREQLDSQDRRVFQWWLIGVTADLNRRQSSENERSVDIHAASRASESPGVGWVSGERLLLGEWPYRSSSWVASWFVQLIEKTPEIDRRTLQRLAAQQIDLHTQGR
ncbi:PIN-like domain-containing protein [Streptomyces niveus]|uniref:PIN-like domain-containing protein n=1 Tax=Streptomyces niveus TaxID=193462 RepID=UPI0036A94615